MEQDPLLSRLEALLVERVPEQVKALCISEPVYCLRLRYYGRDEGEGAPTLMLPPEALRRKIIAEKGAGAPYYIWCADELDSLDEVTHVVIHDSATMRGG